MDSLLFSRYNSSNSFRLGGGNVNAYRLRLAAVSVLSLILSWFFLPVFSGILNIGNITGILLFGGLLLYVLNLHRIRLHMKKNQRTPLRFLLIVVKVFLLLAFITALVESFFMAKACISKPEPESTVVVLGCQNGSRMMLSRVNAATEYLSKHPDTICILSGGAGSDEAIPEALSSEGLSLRPRRMCSRFASVRSKRLNTLRYSIAGTAQVLSFSNE